MDEQQQQELFSDIADLINASSAETEFMMYRSQRAAGLSPAHLANFYPDAAAFEQRLQGFQLQLKQHTPA